VLLVAQASTQNGCFSPVDLLGSASEWCGLKDKLSLNPVRISEFAQSELSRTKTDSADSATIAPILVEVGVDAAIARERGKVDVIAIRGALILSQGLKA